MQNLILQNLFEFLVSTTNLLFFFYLDLISNINLFIVKCVKNAKYGMKVKIIDTERKESYKNIFFE